jgi:hypothetical protein
MKNLLLSPALSKKEERAKAQRAPRDYFQRKLDGYFTWIALSAIHVKISVASVHSARSNRPQTIIIWIINVTVFMNTNTYSIPGLNQIKE